MELKLEHGKTYISGGGTIVRIRKEAWDSWYLGFAVSNGVYMGCYNEKGVSQEGEPTVANLVKEVP